MVKIRRMEPGDIEESEVVWHQTWRDLRRRFQLPADDVTPHVAARLQSRIRHLLATDPSGAYVAHRRGRLVGLSQALVRDDLWVLSLLGVAVDAQGDGVGRRLLDAALTYGADLPGLILCSRDPRAMRAYARAGFDMHPAITAWGNVRHDGLGVSDAVHVGASRDLEAAAEIDRRIRGASHGPDFNHLLEDGAELFLHDGGGYVFVRDGSPLLLAAEHESTATELLLTALTRAPTDTDVEVRWLTANQQWAIRVSLSVGLELHPVGPVMVRNLPGPPHPYLPTGAFG